MKKEPAMASHGRESELARTVSWKEMFHSGSTRSSPARPPLARTSVPHTVSLPGSPARHEYNNGSFTKLLNSNSDMEPKEEEKVENKETNHVPPATTTLPALPEQQQTQTTESTSKKDTNMKDSETLEQIVNPSSLNVANAQLAMYIAMAHAGLVLGILVFFGIGLLLKGYYKPIQWAVLISMPLREIQGALVTFWEEPLQTGLMETLLAVPAFILKNLLETGDDMRDAILGMLGKRELTLPKKKIGFAKLSRWLLAFAVCTVLYDFLGPVALATTSFVGVLVYAGVMSLLPFFLDHPPTLNGKGTPLTQFYGWTVQPVIDAMRWSNRGLTRSIAASLPTLVAVVLILMIFLGFLSGSILFTYKVGMETKDAIVTLKTHVDRSNYAETMGLNKWVEENNVTQQIDSYMAQAYETLLQQVDAFGEKNNMTEAAKVGKEFLGRLSHKGKVIGAENETEAMAVSVPSHPIVERLQNIKAKLRMYDFGGAYAEAEAASSLGLELFQIGQEDLMEKAKQMLQKSSDIGKTVVVSGSNLMGRGFYFVLFLWSSLASGAAGVINFITKTIIFFSVLYYLITSESAVMNQVLNMVPLSDSVRSRCADVLDHAVSSVLLATLKASFFQATFTWLLFTWFRIHFLYMSTFLAMFQAVLPLFPNWLAALPGGAQLALEGRYVEAVVLMIVHVYGMDYGLAKIHKEIPGHNGYLTGLSIAGGMALFSPALEGAIMGPLIMTVLLAAKNLYAEFVLGAHTNLHQSD